MILTELQEMIEAGLRDHGFYELEEKIEQAREELVRRYGEPDAERPDAR